jgi:hypothetical protein
MGDKEMNKIIMLMLLVLVGTGYANAMPFLMPFDDGGSFGGGYIDPISCTITDTCKCGGIGEMPCKSILQSSGSSWNWILSSNNYDLSVKIESDRSYVTVRNHGGDMTFGNILKVSTKDNKYYEFTINRLWAGDTQRIYIPMELRERIISIEANPENKWGELNNKDNYFYLG